MGQISMKRGFWFYFTHEGIEISVHGSAWSGKETVYVDNHPVSIKRSFRFSTEHYFKANEKEYKAVVTVLDMWLGKIQVELFCDGELVGTEEKAYVTRDPKSWQQHLKEFLIILIVAFAVGYSVGFGIAYFL